MSYFVSSEEEIIDKVQNLKFPVVMKIVSSQILHKSDVGGVILDLMSVEQIVSAYNQILISVKEKVPDAEIKGVLIEEQVEYIQQELGNSMRIIGAQDGMRLKISELLQV